MAERRAKRGTRSGSAAAPGDAPPDVAAAAIAAAMRLFADQGWAGVTLADIARAADLPFAALHGVFTSKAAVLRGFLDGVDRAVLAAAPEEGASVREALFELMMRRFDALQPHRAALGRLAGELPRDPAAAACIALRGLRSIAAIAERAGVETGGPLGGLRVKALAGLQAWVSRIWLADDSADMARTMKALDSGLARLEAVARGFPGPRTHRAAA
jgi:AcrR family transcriptional regulator